MTLLQTIAADTSTVWKYLTDAQILRLWMSETDDFSVTADWKTGGAIRIQSFFNGAVHISEGIITTFKTEEVLAYEHVNSISANHYKSRKPDKLEFKLESVPEGTQVTLTCSTGYGEVEEKHLRLYWTVTLQVLKKVVENSTLF